MLSLLSKLPFPADASGGAPLTAAAAAPPFLLVPVSAAVAAAGLRDILFVCVRVCCVSCFGVAACLLGWLS